MLKENFYVITGGPGAGKTSLLDCLASRGYSYISETARQIIKTRLSNGFPPRPDPFGFAQAIFDKDCANFISHSHLTSTLFFDRSLLDSAWQLINADELAHEQIKNVVIQNRYNPKVFIAPPWKEIYTNDTERDQTFEESIKVYEELKKWYVQHGYETVEIPKRTIEERVIFILGHIAY